MNKRSEEIGIVIADDHIIFREGLRKLLEAKPGFQVLGEAADGEQALNLARQLQPEILLLDVRMPKLSGLEVLRELKNLAIQPRTIVLTVALERDQIVQALQLGARGIILKHSATAVLFEGLRCVVAGQYWVCHESVSDLVQALQKLTPHPQGNGRRREFGLTPRETEVIALIVAGFTNKDIAEKFAISEHTVKHHLTSIFTKLGVSNRLELAFFSIDHHLLDNVQMTLD
jgi:DNA-binding NarL/FixJ family response regulator